MVTSLPDELVGGLLAYLVEKGVPPSAKSQGGDDGTALAICPEVRRLLRQRRGLPADHDGELPTDVQEATDDHPMKIHPPWI